jgi:hypothetical protein
VVRTDGSERACVAVRTEIDGRRLRMNAANKASVRATRSTNAEPSATACSVSGRRARKAASAQTSRPAVTAGPLGSERSRPSNARSRSSCAPV